MANHFSALTVTCVDTGEHLVEIYHCQSLPSASICTDSQSLEILARNPESLPETHARAELLAVFGKEMSILIVCPPPPLLKQIFI